MSGVKLGGRESDLTIPECGLAIMPAASRETCVHVNMCRVYMYNLYFYLRVSRVSGSAVGCRCRRVRVGGVVIAT